MISLNSWKPAICFKLLAKTVSKIPIQNICPNIKDVFKAFVLCPYENCNVVFLGQDPYPQEGVATGILFGNSNSTPETKISPSLRVVKNSVINIGVNCYFDNSLEDWAKQGILMINSALTVETNKIGSHSLIWRPFIADFLSRLSKQKKGIIYVLFGNQAQSFIPYIDSTNNYILTEKHPAFYARTGIEMPNKVFIETNKYLSIQGKPIINWYKEKI